MLNPQQQAAVTYIDGPLLVLAGAGSGKTRVITQKIAYLIKECGYAANSVFAVTFTNKAANEMRSRIAAVIDRRSRHGLKVATFHRLGLSIIRKHTAVCDLKKGFTILDSEDSLQMLRKFLTPGQAKDKEYLFRLQQQISNWKNDLLEPETVLKLPQASPFEQEAALIYPQYQSTLLASNAVDFDDLIRLPVMLLSKHEDIRTYWQNQVRHLLVDEYQDSNISQYRLVLLLAGIRACFTVVGDDDQSIYAWRGARPENLVQLEKDFKHLKVIKLEQNYRSTARILTSANHLIANNPHIYQKKLWSELGQGELIRVLCCKDEQHEAEQVVADMLSHKLRYGRQFNEYAILYRGNHQSRVFEKALRDQGIAYKISGGQSWFSRAEIRDIFAYLKLIVNPQDNAAFLRIINVPRRGIGDSSLSALADYAQKKGQALYECCDHIALSQMLDTKPRQALRTFKEWLESVKMKLAQQMSLEHLGAIIEDTAYEAWIYEQSDSPAKAQKRMDSIWELLEWVLRLYEKEADRSLEDVINTLILIDILEQSDEVDKDTVQLLTLHASKGLEFPFVYLVGMEEELLPHRSSIEEDSIEEERRLAYVGITRAQKELCLTLAKQRKRGGELKACEPSRFLEELPEDNLEWFGKGLEKDERKSRVLAKSHLDGLKNLLQKV